MKKILLPCVLLILSLSALAGLVNYTVLPQESRVEFIIKNFGQNVAGSLSIQTAEILFDEKNAEKSSFKIVLDAKSINTSNTLRDDRLRRAEYFAAEQFPIISFTSKKTEKTNLGYLVNGLLTIRSKTMPVSIPFRTARNNSGKIEFTGSFAINRLDFGVGEQSLSIQDSVYINISVIATK